jgi:alkaline phosphatase
MKRRDFFRTGTAATLGSSLFASTPSALGTAREAQAKNVIFMVSDGMSTGTLNLADLLRQRKEGRSSHWLGLYRDNRVRRALMDTASASSLVTDSAAASSAWGGGVRVPNGALNVSADGREHRPILQKFKAAGKAVGCVTTVPITHATPAGFCVVSKSRGSMNDIALQYLDLRFDVMLGGGTEQFIPEKRADKKDLFAQFRQQGYQVARTRDELLALKSGGPVLGVFHEDGLPYALDRAQDAALQAATPTLAEMTAAALARLRQSPKGFVLQVEGGKVDWGAHANDVGALLYDQLAFDDAVNVVLAFAEQDKNTLVVLTTDHGNANPGLFSGGGTNRNFDRIQQFRHTNNWILNGITKDFTASQVIERVEAAQGIVFKPDEAQSLLSHYSNLDETGVYNARKLPFRPLAQLQTAHTSVGWAGMDHSADFVELAMVGPGSEALPAFVKNTDLHLFLLNATGVKSE